MDSERSPQEAIAKEADRIEEDCLYSAKGHFESARIWGRWNLGLGVPAAIIAAVAGATGLRDQVELAAGLAMLSGTITAILTFLKPSERASSHQKAGTLYTSLKNRARVFRQVELMGSGKPATFQRRLRQLSEQRNSLNEASPEILRPAFVTARKAIEAGEAKYRIDAAEGER